MPAPKRRRIVPTVTNQPIKHNDIDREAWIQASVATGVPADYSDMLRLLTETIASGHGSRPNDDVQTVTGVVPISFADFAQRTKQAWMSEESDDPDQQPRRLQGAGPVLSNHRGGP